MNNVTLQINLCPLDYPRVTHLLPHQLKTFASQCNEQLVILDLKKSNSKKSSGEQWDRNIQPTIDYLQSLKRSDFPDLAICEVDYSDSTRKIMSKTIMKHGTIPDKDYSGGPYYSYFYGIYKSKFDHVLHIDADMMFGGGCQSWVSEAVSLLKKDSKLFSCSPLAGPPLSVISILPSNYRTKFNPVKHYTLPGSYLYSHFSTRVFLVNKSSLYKKISVQRPNFDHFIKALIRGASPWRYPEGTISGFLIKKKLYRLDFHGTKPGLWCLHPSGNPQCKELLPQLIHLVESNKFPDSQRGFCDINDEFLKNASESTVTPD